MLEWSSVYSCNMVALCNIQYSQSMYSDIMRIFTLRPETCDLEPQLTLNITVTHPGHHDAGEDAKLDRTDGGEATTVHEQ